MGEIWKTNIPASLHGMRLSEGEVQKERIRAHMTGWLIPNSLVKGVVNTGSEGGIVGNQRTRR